MSLSQEQLKSRLRYVPETGEFFWLPVPGARLPNMRAGTLKSDGYIEIGLPGRKYLAHVLAWLYMTGSMPANEIDHRDLNRSNNVWTNLRPATRAQNAANRRLTRTNKCGVRGVQWDVKSKRWVARFRMGGKTLLKRYFLTIEEASSAYEEAAKAHFGEFFNPNP